MKIFSTDLRKTNGNWRKIYRLEKVRKQSSWYKMNQVTTFNRKNVINHTKLIHIWTHIQINIRSTEFYFIFLNTDICLVVVPEIPQTSYICFQLNYKLKIDKICNNHQTNMSQNDITNIVNTKSYIYTNSNTILNVNFVWFAKLKMLLLYQELLEK